MERLLFVMNLHPGVEAEYEKRHAAVWPALLEDIWNAGLRNCSLFRRELNVYAYAECHPDRATCLAALSESKTNAEWSAWFGDIVEVFRDVDGKFLEAVEVWHLEDARAAAGLASPAPGGIDVLQDRW